MDPEPRLNQDLCREVEAMMPPRSDRLEGLAIRLRKKYPTLAEDVDGAIGHAVERLITTQRQITTPFGYLTACTENELKRLYRLRARYESLDALRDELDWEPAAEQLSIEEQALAKATYDELREHVETWEPGGVRVITSLYLEAAYKGNPLSSLDAAELASDILGEEVGDNFVRTWKSRGLKKLRQYVQTRPEN